jgi:hypothetical protein
MNGHFPVIYIYNRPAERDSLRFSRNGGDGASCLEIRSYEDEVAAPSKILCRLFMDKNILIISNYLYHEVLMSMSSRAREVSYSSLVES